MPLSSGGGPSSSRPHRLPACHPPSHPSVPVQRLKAGQPANEAVREGLNRLDSRAVAALLKELSKAGLPHRASGALAAVAAAVCRR